MGLTLSDNFVATSRKAVVGFLMFPPARSFVAVRQLAVGAAGDGREELLAGTTARRAGWLFHPLPPTHPKMLSFPLGRSQKMKNKLSRAD